MALSSAFCCASLKKGTLIVGWLSLGIVLLHAAIVSVALASHGPMQQNGDGNGFPERHSGFELPPSAQYAIFYGKTAICITVLVCLLHGASEGRRGLLLPYLVLMGIATAGNVVQIILKLDSGEFWLKLVPFLIAIPIDLYCFAIVYSYYKELSPENQLQDPKRQAIPEAV